MKDGDSKRGFRVDELKAASEQECACASCGWSGRQNELQQIVGCTLEAGKPVPSGRCPSCNSLVTVHAGGATEIGEALRLMQQLVEMDEKLRKGKSVPGEEYAATLKAAKRAAKKAVAELARGNAARSGCG